MANVGPSFSELIEGVPTSSAGPPYTELLDAIPGVSMGPPFTEEIVAIVPGIKGKQVALGPDGINTANLADGLLSANDAGRAKVADGFFDLATVTDTFQDSSIPASKIVGGGGGQFTTADKSRAPLATSGNYQTTALTITNTPVTGSYVQVLVNGIGIPVGDGDRDDLGDFTNNVGCYFSGDGGATARAMSAIVAGDTLYWNGTHIGYDLVATDQVDFNYLM